MDELYRRQPLRAGFSVDTDSGLLAPAAGFAVTPLPIPLRAGARVAPKIPGARWQVFFYRAETAPEYLYTYCYEPEENWTRFDAALSDPDLRGGTFLMPCDGFVRLAVSGGAGIAEDCFAFAPDADAPEPAPAWMEAELARCASRVREKRRAGDLCLLLLGDSHFCSGGIWPDTLQSLRRMAALIEPAAVVHLGDLSDGMLRAAETRHLAACLLRQLRGVCGTLWLCLGNHDLNYFRGNPERFSRGEGARLYFGGDRLWHAVDRPAEKLRLIFLDSFDPGQEERYGFDRAELRWFLRCLRETPRGWRVLVFSHVTPVSGMHVWSRRIRGGKAMLGALRLFRLLRPGAVCGWICGHNHADQLVRVGGIPIVSIGCSKLESFPEHKPAGSVSPERRRGDSTQELWDVLLVHADGSLDFVRFGAGEDRHLEGGAP